MTKKMGIDSSQYSLKKQQNLEALVSLMDFVCKNVYKPRIGLTLTAKSKNEISKIAKSFKPRLQNLGLGFSSSEISKTANKIARSENEIRTLSVTIPYDRTENQNSIHLAYNKLIKNTSAYIGLRNYENKYLLENLSKFLAVINEYSDFGPKDENDIEQLSTTFLKLNSNVIGQNQWIFKTGCIDFEPTNENLITSNGKTFKTLSGLKVQFSKIHALAYKANGPIKMLKELSNVFDFSKINVNLTTNSIEDVSIIDDQEIFEYYCNFYYQLDDFSHINEMSWAFENNEYSITLEDAKLNNETTYRFNVYLSGNSVNNIDLDLFIDVEASKEYKEKVVGLFKNKLKYIGDG